MRRLFCKSLYLCVLVLTDAWSLKTFWRQCKRLLDNLWPSLFRIYRNLSSLITADSIFQIRVTAAEPGRVDFELDIRKEHTVHGTESPHSLDITD